MKKILIFLLLFLTLPCLANSTLMVDVDTGKVIYSRDSSKTVSIASLTKMVTVLTVIKANQPMSQSLRVTGSESSPRIYPGMYITRKGLIELSLISSDNLAARTLLEHYPGGYKKGLVRMNQLMKSIGAKSTHLVDATGLLPGNISTLGDLVKILEETGRYRIFGKLSNLESLYVSIAIVKKNSVIPSQTIARSTNPYNYESRSFSIVSAKTGYTRAAGFCLAMYVVYKNKRYILITTGNKSKYQRKNQSDKLLDLILISKSPA